MRESNSPTRRQFLRNSVVAAAGAATVPLVGACGEQQSFTRTTCRTTSGGGKPPAWPIACRDAHLREIGQPDSWTAMTAIGADGVEVLVKLDLSCEYLMDGDAKYSLADANSIRTLGQRFKNANKRIVAFCLSNNFDNRPDEEVACTVKVAEAAAELGVPAVRLDFVPRQLKDKEDEFLKLSVTLARRIIEQTKGSKICFGVENHGGTTNKIEFLRKFFAEVGSDRFGLTMDTGNFYWFGYPLSQLYDIYAEFAPVTFHTHCKSIAYPETEREKRRQTGWEYGKYCSPVYEGDIDFARVTSLLRRAGYRGSLCIENESLGRVDAAERAGILAREVDHLRAVATATA